VLGRAGQPLRAVLDVSEPRTEHISRVALRKKLIAALENS